MKSKPILLKGPLVRRTLAGLKTQTRRLVKASLGSHAVFRPAECEIWDGLLGNVHIPCPYGVPGDRLWVRETWRHNCYVVPGEGPVPGVVHKATLTGVPVRSAPWGLETESKWRPGIFMPREAARLALIIQEVRVERIQDITDAAVRAEGVADLTFEEMLEMSVSRRRIVNGVRDLGWRIDSANNGIEDMVRRFLRSANLIVRFRLVWDLINGRRTGARWADNPWVWVIRYRRHDA